MSDARSTQALAEVLYGGDATARSTQALAQVLYGGDATARSTQVVVQVLYLVSTLGQVNATLDNASLNASGTLPIVGAVNVALENARLLNLIQANVSATLENVALLGRGERGGAAGDNDGDNQGTRGLDDIFRRIQSKRALLEMRRPRNARRPRYPVTPPH